MSRRRSLLPFALFALFASVSTAHAQISPGDLSEAHQHLEGMAQCTSCHELGGGSRVEPRCRDCHQEIERTLNERRGYHGLAGLDQCSDCHPEHGGRDFALIEWPGGVRESFDHAEAGWELTGKHASQDCAACHRPAFQVSQLMSLVDRKDAARSFLGLERSCVACHEDRHEGRFGANCSECHVTSEWSSVKAEGFDHARTRFPLLGKHARVECMTCHDPERAWGKNPAFARCTDCHEDPHAGQATLEGRVVDCDACHSLEGFSPSTYERARHARAPFALEGMHRDLSCSECHATGRDEVARSRWGSAGLQIRMRHGVCTDCHEDAHAGQLSDRPDGGACTSCHSVEGFEKVRFSVADHQDTLFPLNGAHADVACRDCHGPRRNAELGPLPDAALIGSAGALLSMGALPCVSCHADPHAGRYESVAEEGRDDGCLACHSTATFSPSKVDTIRHAALGRPLEGAHATLPCFACHAELESPPASSTLLASRPGVRRLAFAGHRDSCEDCHESPHGQQFVERTDRGACLGCHSQDSFEPATGFDHERDARFQLRGAHVNVKCAECHFEEASPTGSTFVRYRPLPKACRDCHR